MATVNIRPTTYRHLNLGSRTGKFKIIPASQKISQCIRFPDLFNVILECALDCSGAQKGIIFTLEEGKPWARSKARRELDGKIFIQACSKAHLSVLEQDDIPIGVIQHVTELCEKLIINKPKKVVLKSTNRFDTSLPLKRLLAFPIVSETETIGIIYLENDSACPPFTEEIVSMISVLCDQAAISFQNIHLFDLLEEKITKQMNMVRAIKKEVETTNCSRSDYLTSINDAIRSKIDNVIGFSKLIQHTEKTNPLTEKTRYYLDHIQKSTQELSELLGNAFIFSSPLTKEFPVFYENLNPKLLTRIIYQSNRESAAKKSVIFRLKYQDPLPKTIHTDRGIINRVLMTIVSRTIQLSRQRDTVDLKVSTTARNLQFVITRKKFRSKTENKSGRAPVNVSDGNSPENENSLLSEMTTMAPFQAFFDFIDLEMIKKSISPVKGTLSTTSKQDISSLTIQVPLKGEPVGNPQQKLRSNIKGKAFSKIPSSLSQKLLLDFQTLMTTPIYKGGTLYRVIRKMRCTCDDYNSNYAALLEEVESAVFEGDKKRLDQLVNKALSDHCTELNPCEPTKTVHNSQKRK